MKKRFLVSILTMIMVSAIMAGCGAKAAETKPVEEPVVEASVEESTDVSTEASTEASVEEATAEISAEEVVEEEPVREVKTYVCQDNDGHGPYEIPSYDPENKYVAKIREAGVSEDVYPGSYIETTKDGWIWYFEPEEGADLTAYRVLGTPDQLDFLQGDELDSFMTEIDANLDEYIAKVESGELPAVDLDGDEKIEYAEAYIASFYFMADKQDKPYDGTVTFFDFHDVLWD